MMRKLGLYVFLAGATLGLANAYAAEDGADPDPGLIGPTPEEALGGPSGDATAADETVDPAVVDQMPADDTTVVDTGEPAEVVDEGPADDATVVDTGEPVEVVDEGPADDTTVVDTGEATQVVDEPVPASEGGEVIYTLGGEGTEVVDPVPGSEEVGPAVEEPTGNVMDGGEIRTFGGETDGSVGDIPRETDPPVQVETADESLMYQSGVAAPGIEAMSDSVGDHDTAAGAVAQPDVDDLAPGADHDAPSAGFPSPMDVIDTDSAPARPAKPK